MGTVIGIDVGGSTTKIVGLRDGVEMMEPMLVVAGDPVTSIYGAFGRFTSEYGLSLDDISRIMVTGVGGAYVNDSLYRCPCTHLREFDCVGRGGLYLSGLREAIVVSMGTGTALIHAKKNGEMTYLGGTGVGGGTILGLSRLTMGMDDIDHIVSLAKEGDLEKIDLRVGEMTKIAKKEGGLGLPGKMTAANFGKISDIATKGDIALGIINMVFEVAAMVAIFNARLCKVKDIILTGNLTEIDQAPEIFESLSRMFDVNFVIPKKAQFSTVIGAALYGAET
ncbi:MAG: type II pantothenate kinase [Ruminococcaceae bacterium]|nr:type II pantothenate kinase [Oscillospiraceae bacterium]